MGNIAVVNAENSAAWTISSENGDKDDVHWSSDGNRVLYTRLQNGVRRVCDKATSAASANLLDPGEGTVSSPRWLPTVNAPQPEPETDADGTTAEPVEGEAEAETKPEVKPAPPVLKVIYAYSGIGEPFRFIVQENKSDPAEREDIRSETVKRRLHWSSRVGAISRPPAERNSRDTFISQGSFLVGYRACFIRRSPRPPAR